MRTLGLVSVAAALVCTWVSVGVQQRGDGRAGHATRVSRRSGLWLLAAVLLACAGMWLLIGSVVRLWL